MKKMNCWEVKKCGRGPGGDKVDELGECPAATNNEMNRLNGGKNGGRVCWFATGIPCAENPQANIATRLSTCMKCSFYQLVRKEEGVDFKTSKEIVFALQRRRK